MPLAIPATMQRKAQGSAKALDLERRRYFLGAHSLGRGNYMNSISQIPFCDTLNLGGVDAPKARTGWFQSRHFYECILETLRL